MFPTGFRTYMKNAKKIFTQNEFSKDFNSKIFESNLSHSSNGVITVINASADVTIHEQRTEKKFRLWAGSMTFTQNFNL